MCYSGQCPYENSYIGTCSIVPSDCPSRSNNTQDKTTLSVEDIQKLKEVLLPLRKCTNCIFNSVCDSLVDGYKKDICQILEG